MSAKLTEIRDYFGYDSNTEFTKDWKKLSDEEKVFFKNGVEKEKAAKK